MKTLRLIVRMILLACTLGALVSCASGGRVHSPTPARGFLTITENPSQGLGAYGYLLLTRRPSSDDTTRYVAACNGYLRNMEPMSAYSPADASLLMVTYWFLYSKPISSPSIEDCPMLVATYDYARAKAMLGSIGMLDARGPILVAWKEPFPQGVGNEKPLVIDLSVFSDQEFDRAFSIWMTHITKNPSVWKRGLNVENAREGFRSFIQKYGDDIIKSIYAVKSLN